MNQKIYDDGLDRHIKKPLEAPQPDDIWLIEYGIETKTNLIVKVKKELASDVPNWRKRVYVCTSPNIKESFEVVGEAFKRKQ